MYHTLYPLSVPLSLPFTNIFYSFAFSSLRIPFLTDIFLVLSFLVLCLLVSGITLHVSLPFNNLLLPFSSFRIPFFTCFFLVLPSLILYLLVSCIALSAYSLVSLSSSYLLSHCFFSLIVFLSLFISPIPRPPLLSVSCILLLQPLYYTFPDSLYHHIFLFSAFNLLFSQATDSCKMPLHLVCIYFCFIPFQTVKAYESSCILLIPFPHVPDPPNERSSPVFPLLASSPFENRAMIALCVFQMSNSLTPRNLP